DFQMWDEAPVSTCLEGEFSSGKEAYRTIKLIWGKLKENPKSYSGFKGSSDILISGGKPIVNINRDTPGFGRCPVASEKTRCCNLLTLDAVEGCGYDCSYCSIRYFYDDDSIGIDEGFIEKLHNIEIDPGRSYHIGTGQSSDSLMWGNKAGILDALLDFAASNPNVILELKTKSDNISHLISRDVPVNVLTTWSLNPQAIIDNEEHFTASLQQRLDAAEQVALKGNLIGFHFHPMVYYQDWERDYGALFSQLQERFQPADVALVSLGTLTFIKPVLKKMRERKVQSKILQMPLEDAEGKYSYPLDIKRKMFQFAYNSLSDWHNRVFFYMCMENISLWKDVFGYEYSDNEAFEISMIDHYEEKIREKRNSHR
ncbi:MAG: DNA repair photolyase, partial [Spirochaetaceae bacterium]|nr:DNA repair photolyase [Spirochaetaceae bacterium]